MGKIAIDQRSLALALLVALGFIYLNFWVSSTIGMITVLIVAILLLLK